MAPPQKGPPVLATEQQPVRTPINSSSTVLIVGTHRDVGRELVGQCLEKGARVIATESPSDSLLDSSACNLRIVKADVTDVNSIKRLGLVLQSEEASVTHLVFSAVLTKTGGNLSATSPEEMQTCYLRNAIGFVIVMQNVIQCLALQAVIAVIGTRMGSVSQNWYSEAYAYRASKIALHMFAKCVAVEYEGKYGVLLLNPGRIGTVPLQASVNGLLKAIEATNIDTEFRFVQYNAEIIPY